MRLLVIDNYDSFTYNLVYLIRELGFEKNMRVVRNDQFELEEVQGYDKILLSPGPGIPDEAGLMKQVIREYGASKSILGICLGHQGISEVYGSQLRNLDKVLHGIQGKTQITDPDFYLFKEIPKEISVAHYHSWVVDEDALGDELEIISKNKEGLIMGIRHKSYDVAGLQFHPESILTDFGREIMDNWIKYER